MRLPNEREHPCVPGKMEMMGRGGPGDPHAHLPSHLNLTGTGVAESRELGSSTQACACDLQQSNSILSHHIQASFEYIAVAASLMEACRFDVVAPVTHRQTHRQIRPGEARPSTARSPPPRKTHRKIDNPETQR